MEKAIPSARWWRIIPVATLMYTISYVDRANISFAFAGMQQELGFNATVAGFVAGIFFVGYLFTQMPGGHIASRTSPKKFVFFAMITWGALATLTGFVHNRTELIIVRFLLGMAEGGVWPSTIVLLSRWFPVQERARANGYWILCIPLGSVVMSPLSGWILHFGDWRWLFIIEGMLPVIWSIVWWFMIEDSPRDARWLSEAERNYILTALEEEQKAISSTKTDYISMLKDLRVWIFLTYLFLEQVGYYGIAMWLPTLVKSFSGAGDVNVGYLTALPWIAAMIGIVLNAWHSDKTGERIKHAAYPLIVGAVFLVISVFLGKQHPVASIACTILAVGFATSYNGVLWAIPAAIFPSKALGGTVGFINGLANLGGFFGPTIVGYLITWSGNYMVGTYFNAVCLVGAALVLLPMATMMHIPTHNKEAIA